VPTDDGLPEGQTEYIGEATGPLPTIEAITAEGPGGSTLTSSAEHNLRDRLAQRDNPAYLSDEVYLLHAAQVIREPHEDKSGRQPGQYSVRVWLEAETSAQVEECTRAFYRLHDTFGASRRVIATEAKDRAFKLQMTVYGEFTVIAYVERQGKSPLWLSRFLDLPGRPPE
jgi:hypothetical protein